MQLGMIGLGRMGGSMVRRLLHGGHACVVFDSQPASMATLAAQGATGSQSIGEFINKLERPRAIWLMLPAAVVEATLRELSPLLQPGDIVIDGGNSHAALFQRFSSRGEDDMANRLLSAMRYQFGGHVELPAEK